MFLQLKQNSQNAGQSFAGFFANGHLRPLPALLALLLIALSFSLTVIAAHAATLSEQLEWSPHPVKNEFLSTAPASHELLSGDGYDLEFHVAPTNRRFHTDGVGEQEEIAQRLAVTYRQQLANALSVSYENSVGFQQTNFLAFGDFNPVSNHVAFASKLNTNWELRKNLAVSGYTMIQHSIASIADTYGDVTRTGGTLAYKPLKGSSIGADVVYQEQYGMDGSMIAQNIYGLNVAQDVPKVPATLHFGAGYANDAGDTITDRESIRGKISLNWKLQPHASWSAGALTQNSDLASSENSENRNSYYVQFSFQPVPITTINMRTAYETFANDEPDSAAAVNVRFGVDVEVTKKINSGFSMQYSVPVSSNDNSVFPAATVFSFGATAFF